MRIKILKQESARKLKKTAGGHKLMSEQPNKQVSDGCYALIKMLCNRPLKKEKTGLPWGLTVAVCFFVLTMLMPATALNAETGGDKGAQQIILEGGSRGPVPFPHHRHQRILDDCKVCHELFPQERGGIVKLKNEGRLMKKQIMNKHCQRCHRMEKKAGKPSGPTACNKCHVRE